MGAAQRMVDEAAEKARQNIESYGEERNEEEGEKYKFSTSDIDFAFGKNQETINEYVDKALSKENTLDYLKYGVPSEKLIKDTSDSFDVSHYYHALRDNDIRHIHNSHGIGTNEKYPITKEDLKAIPFIVQNYDKVIPKTDRNGNPGIVYVKVSEKGLTYYLEAVTTQYGNEPLLVNKQMIKTGIDDIPNIFGLYSAISKKQSQTEFLNDLKQIQKAYVQNVYQSNSVNQMVPQSQKNVKHSVSDQDYLSAVKRGDMEESQRMVDEVAKTAGYSVKAYHQTSSDFTVFNTDNPVAGRYDSETPSGIFFKTNDHDIGLGGKKQMAVFLNVGKFSVCINISM